MSLLLLSEARARSGNTAVLSSRRDQSSNQARGRGQSAGRACRQEGALRPMRERHGEAGAGRGMSRTYEGAAWSGGDDRARAGGKCQSRRESEEAGPGRGQRGRGLPGAHLLGLRAASCGLRSGKPNAWKRSQYVAVVRRLCGEWCHRPFPPRPGQPWAGSFHPPKPCARPGDLPGPASAPGRRT